MVLRSPLYLAILLFTVTALAIHVSLLRIRKKITLGDGGDKELSIAIRRHGNSLEHGVVIGLLAIVFDLQRAPFTPFNWGNINRSACGEILLMLAVASRVIYALGGFRSRKIHPATATLTYFCEVGLIAVIVINYFFGA